MEQVEKLDKIIIEDNLNLSVEELFARAKDIADEKSLQFGWTACELRSIKSNILPTSGYRRFEYDIFGLSNQGAEVPSATNKENLNRTPNAAASSPDTCI
jgi:hypothetical protein